MKTEQLITILDHWIKCQETQEQTLRENDLIDDAERCMAMAQAYWNVKQLIEVNP